MDEIWEDLCFAMTVRGGHLIPDTEGEGQRQRCEAPDGVDEGCRWGNMTFIKKLSKYAQRQRLSAIQLVHIFLVWCNWCNYIIPGAIILITTRKMCYAKEATPANSSVCLS
jgi:hypothetical protein